MPMGQLPLLPLDEMPPFTDESPTTIYEMYEPEFVRAIQWARDEGLTAPLLGSGTLALSKGGAMAFRIAASLPGANRRGNKEAVRGSLLQLLGIIVLWYDSLDVGDNL